MSRPGSQLERLIDATRRRLLIADAVRLGGLCVTASAAAAFMLTLANLFVALGLPWWAIAIVALSGLPVACAIAWARRAQGISAAVLLDDELHLKDRLGTAIALGSDSSMDHDNPMSRWVHEDAERLAARIDPRAAAPVNWPMSWGVAALVGLSCVPLLWFISPRNVFAGPPPTPEQIAALDARQQAAEALRQRAEELRKIDANDKQAQEPADSQAKQQALDTLDRLAKQLDSPPAGSPEGSTKAGGSNDAQLSSAAHQAIELADRLDQQSQIEREAQKRTIDGLSDIEPPATPGSADEFAQSLKNGDLAGAQQWLESLEERLKNAPPEEREALANSLRHTADQIKKAADNKDESTKANSSESPEEKLKDLGLTPEQIKQWSEQPPSVDDIRRELQDQGQDPIDAQKLAEQAQRDLAQHAADEKAKEQLEETAKRVSDLADSVEQPPSPPQPEQPVDNAAPDEQTPQPPTPPKDGDNGQPDPSRPDAATPPASSSPDTSKTSDGKSGEQKSPDANPPSSSKDGEPKNSADQSQGDKQPGQQPSPTSDQSQSGENGKPSETDKPKETTKPGESTQPGKEGQPKESPIKAPGVPGESPLTNPVPNKDGNDPGATPKPKEGDQPPTNPRTGQPDQPQDGQGEPKTGEGAKPEHGNSGEPKAGEPNAGDGAQPEPNGAPKTNVPTAGNNGEQGQPEPGATPSPDGQTPGAKATPGGDQADNSTPGVSDAPGEGVGDKAKRLRDMLDQIDRTGKSADQGQEISQKMRDTAKDLLDRMSPEEREELKRWAEEKAKENGAGDGSGRNGSPKSLLDRTLPTQAVQNPKLFEYDTQDVDLMPKDAPPNDRVIAEMYGSDQKRPDGAIDRQPMNSEQVRQAAKAIERALNEEAIPPRYRALIRNWARRLPKSDESAPQPESTKP